MLLETVPHDNTLADAYTHRVHALRRLAFRNRALVSALFALALMMKLLVPAGFMPAFDHGQIVMSICSGTAPMTMVMAMPGMEHGKQGDSQHGKSEQPCAFSGLSAPSLAAADPVLLALAILFVIALALHPMVPSAVRQRRHLRPLLRGPPATF